MRINFQGLAKQQTHGYGRLSVKLRQALSDAGAYLCDSFEYGWDLRVVVGQPLSWFIPAPQPDLVMNTMWEAVPMPSFWVPLLNNCGAVWVPTTWVREVFEEGGVVAPMFVAGYGVDPEEFAPVERDADPDRPYTFLAHSRVLADRKQALQVVRAFARLGLPNARLILKQNFNLFSVPRGGAPFRVTHDGKPVEGVTIISEDYSISELARLYARVDCMVYPTHAEGFGLMPLEAMATGLPIICPNHSGLRDTIREDVALIIPTKGMERATLQPGGEQTCEWYALDFDVMCDQMAWCYWHRARALEMGQRAAEYVAREWSWQAAGKRALALLQAHADSLSGFAIAGWPTHSSGRDTAGMAA